MLNRKLAQKGTVGGPLAIVAINEHAAFSEPEIYANTLFMW